MENTTKKYALVYGDPPWKYRVWSQKGQGRSAESHYSTMDIENICALPVKNITATDCALFLWVTFPTLPDAFKVIEAWGFLYKTTAFCYGQ